MNKTAQASGSIEHATGGGDAAKGREYPVIFSTGEEVTDFHSGRMRYSHQLDLAGNIRLDRINSGRANVLDWHPDKWGGKSAGEVTLGIIKQGSVRLTPKGLEGTIRFMPDDKLPEGIRNGLETRVLQNLSISATVHSLERVEREGEMLARITDWEPYEVSVVPAGADQELISK